ncbi:MAG: type II toxin-antitoxin system RelE/ParE family toxin [Hyphomicrobiaceae bacterium]
MKVVYAPRALRDIDEILAYIAKRSPRGAHNVSLAIEYTIHMCALNPRTGAKTDEPNVYRRPLGKYRYTIFYRTLAGEQGIEVARAIHSTRVKHLGKLPEDE